MKKRKIRVKRAANVCRHCEEPIKFGNTVKVSDVMSDMNILLHAECFRSLSGDDWYYDLYPVTAKTKVKKNKAVLKTQPLRIKNHTGVCYKNRCQNRVSSIREMYCLHHNCSTQYCQRVRYSTHIPYCKPCYDRQQLSP